MPYFPAYVEVAQDVSRGIARGFSSYPSCLYVAACLRRTKPIHARGTFPNRKLLQWLNLTSVRERNNTPQGTRLTPVISPSLQSKSASVAQRDHQKPAWASPPASYVPPNPHLHLLSNAILPARRLHPHNHHNLPLPQPARPQSAPTKRSPASTVTHPYQHRRTSTTPASTHESRSARWPPRDRKGQMERRAREECQAVTECRLGRYTA